MIKKILVTGGNGFIGSGIVDKLISMNYEVIVIDNQSAIVHDNFYFNDKAKNYNFDICDYASTRPLYEGVDIVFHLAAESRIQPTIDNPLLAIKTNTLGTGTILQCAREAGGGTGFSSSGVITTEQTYISQTTGAFQTLQFSSEL